MYSTTIASFIKQDGVILVPDSYSIRSLSDKELHSTVGKVRTQKQSNRALQSFKHNLSGKRNMIACTYACRDIQTATSMGIKKQLRIRSKI